jgi:hypothetical protein
MKNTILKRNILLAFAASAISACTASDFSASGSNRDDPEMPEMASIFTDSSTKSTLSSIGAKNLSLYCEDSLKVSGQFVVQEGARSYITRRILTDVDCHHGGEIGIWYKDYSIFFDHVYDDKVRIAHMFDGQSLGGKPVANFKTVQLSVSELVQKLNIMPVESLHKYSIDERKIDATPQSTPK